MKIFKSRIVKSSIAVLTALLLTIGLLPGVLPKGLLTSTANAAEETETLAEGSYVEGEALVYMVEIGAFFRSYGSDDLLAGAERLMQIDNPFPEEETEEDLPGTEEGISLFARFAEPLAPTVGVIKLVKSDTMTTQELIEELLQDPRVIYAEPNYLVTLEGEEETSTEENAEDETEETPIEEKTEEKKEEETEESTEEETKNLTTDYSTFGPDGTPFSAKIPDMTRWQWGNYNDGSMAGLYTHTGAVDIGYAAWNTDAEKQAMSDHEFVVAVLDTGIDETNSDLSGVLWKGEVFGPGGDEHGFNAEQIAGATSTSVLTGNHGTHVAGIIGAAWDGEGVSGVAPNVKLMSLRFDQSLAGTISCLDYAKLAIANGVDLRVINNSWSFGSCASDIINVAITELGQLGVVSVFAAGNSSQNTDEVLDTSSTMVSNPYIVVVDSLAPTGQRSSFSNYGIATTDVCAPGGIILSTTISQEAIIAEKNTHIQFMGEVNAYSQDETAKSLLVSYTNFEEASSEAYAGSAGAFESFSRYIYDITESGPVIFGDNIQYPVIKTQWGSFDGEGVLSVDTNTEGKFKGYAGIQSGVKDLSGVVDKPRYLSFRCRGVEVKDGLEEDTCALTPLFVEIPIIKTAPDGTTEKIVRRAPITGTGTDFGTPPGTYFGGCANLSDLEGYRDGYTYTIDWEQFSFAIAVVLSNESGSELRSGKVYFDSIALGSGRYPQLYKDGTSMASPSVAGIVAVLAGKDAGNPGTAGTAAYAEKLAAVTKSAAETSAVLDGVCATSAYATVDGAANPGPVITSVEDGETSFTLTGYFLDNTTVTLSSPYNSNFPTTGWNVIEQKALGNDKYEITVEKADKFFGDSPIIEVRSDVNGKKDRCMANLSEKQGTEPIELFKQIILTEEAAQISKWPGYDLIGYAGRIYILPRTAVFSNLVQSNADSIFAYDPRDNTVQQFQIPVDELTQDGEPVLQNVVDTTACLKDGKLYILITGASAANAYDPATVLVTLDEDGTWTMLGSAPIYNGLPGLATLAGDGEQLYLLGGFNKTDKGESASKQIFKLEVDEDQIIQEEDVTDQFCAYTPRNTPHVIYANDAFVLSGGTVSNGKDVAEGIERVSKNGKEQFVFQGWLPKLSYAVGALSDGGFIAAGPKQQALGMTDVFIFSKNGIQSYLYSENVSTGNLLAPALSAYNGSVYVLTNVLPANSGDKTMVFASSKMEDMTSAIAMGDGLAKGFVSQEPMVGSDLPAFSNTDLLVTSPDIYDNFGMQKGSELIAQHNDPDNTKDSIIYLSVNKLAEGDVPDADHTEIQAAAKQAQVLDNGLFWMDIKLWLQVNTQQPEQMHTLLNSTRATIGIPDSMKGKSGSVCSYKIFAYHTDAPEGQKLEVIEPEYNAKDQTLSFDISRCSTYAIGYTETVQPDTGDPGYLMWVIIGIAAAIGIAAVLLIWRKKSRA